MHVSSHQYSLAALGAIKGYKNTRRAIAAKKAEIEALEALEGPFRKNGKFFSKKNEIAFLTLDLADAEDQLAQIVRRGTNLLGKNGWQRAIAQHRANNRRY